MFPESKSDARRRPRALKNMIASQRLDNTYSGKRELLALNFLFKYHVSGSSLLHALQAQVLAMACRDNSKDPFVGIFGVVQANTYNSLSPSERKLAEELFKNRKLVEAVLFSIFRWFGSNNGKCALEELLEVLNDHPVLKKMRNEWERGMKKQFKKAKTKKLRSIK